MFTNYCLLFVLLLTIFQLSFYAEGKHHSFLISDADRIDSLIIRIIEALAVAFPKVPYE